MYILTNFYGKKILSGNLAELLAAYINDANVPNDAKVYEIVKGQAVLVRQYNL